MRRQNVNQFLNGLNHAALNNKLFRRTL